MTWAVPSTGASTSSNSCDTDVGCATTSPPSPSSSSAFASSVDMGFTAGQAMVYRKDRQVSDCGKTYSLGLCLASSTSSSTSVPGVQTWYCTTPPVFTGATTRADRARKPRKASRPLCARNFIAPLPYSPKASSILNVWNTGFSSRLMPAWNPSMSYSSLFILRCSR